MLAKYRQYTYIITTLAGEERTYLFYAFCHRAHPERKFLPYCVHRAVHHTRSEVPALFRIG